MKKLTVFIFFIAILGYSQDIELELIASGFTNPVNAAHAGDSRIFVVEQQGVIKILNDDGTVNSSPFLNINSIVSDSGGERGLLGLAFHPDYNTNGFFYVNYINNSGDTVVSRFTRNTTSTADPNSELVLLTIPQPFSNHNAGDMHFGPDDDYLYIATGDGGSGGDPLNNSQDLSNLLGKILRIDVDNTTANPNLNYAIPNDNPFVGDSNARDEIWSYGLRNPWRFSFDRLNGDMWIADVGQSNKEEINRVLNNSPGGENFGWRCYEGNSTFNTNGCGSASNFTFPVAEYSYGGNPFKCSITGGYRYRGSQQTDLAGLYFFADFCSCQIGYLNEDTPGSFQLNFIETFPGENFCSFIEDHTGELYVISLNSDSISKIKSTELGTDQNSLNNIKVYPNPAHDKISISVENAGIKAIRIMDIQGKLITSYEGLTDNKMEISVQNLESGIYLLELISSSGSKAVKKLLVK
jgi:hypothetical protein